MKQAMAGSALPVLALLAVLCFSSSRSELLKRCKADDSKCAKESAIAFTPIFAAGLPEYGVKQLDPITYKKIDCSSPNLKLILTDVTVTGMKDCMMKKVKRDVEKKKIFIKLLCSCQMEGQYEMKGRLLILPIEGKGPIHVTLRKAEISGDIDINEIEKNGAKYWSVTGWRHTYTLKDKSDIVFENLFNGNEVLARAANDVIKESGNDIVYEVGSPAIKASVDSVIENIKNLFDHLSVDQLSLD